MDVKKTVCCVVEGVHMPFVGGIFMLPEVCFAIIAVLPKNPVLLVLEGLT